MRGRGDSAVSCQRAAFRSSLGRATWKAVLVDVVDVPLYIWTKGLETSGLTAGWRVRVTLHALSGVTIDDGFDKLPLKVPAFVPSCSLSYPLAHNFKMNSQCVSNCWGGNVGKSWRCTEGSYGRKRRVTALHHNSSCAVYAIQKSYWHLTRGNLVAYPVHQRIVITSVLAKTKRCLRSLEIASHMRKRFLPFR